ncbi:caspase domain-containing protein [Mycena rosella]|uniref:Caspase domain-containing protein n=1 Tax=Mycena rosella TaxID=1033263 RepID=A0AAD7GWW6_MYCRO|nr:caspase domain-containing protein [Mycena rosella]
MSKFVLASRSTRRPVLEGWRHMRGMKSLALIGHTKAFHWFWGPITGPLPDEAFQPAGTDLVKTFPSSKKRCPMTLTYRLQDPERNLSNGTQYLSNTIPDLRGCVNDAHTIKTFLTNRFHIPEPQIAFLANEEATRAAILEKFQTHLIDNSSIEQDDTMLIYYAGHGSRAPAPQLYHSTDGKIETLVPHDERMKTAGGEDIHGIPDTTINMLLSRLATEKGNNITVIFDCCHSGGLSRGSSPNILPVPRFVETLLPIPANLDQGLFGGRSGNVSLPPDTRHKFMESHVLLAACRQQQRAQECLSATGVPCGFFTDSLVKQLRAVGPNRITYAELLDLLPTLPDQHPQCEGANKDRFLFAVEGPARDAMSCALRVRADGEFEIDAGSLHGIVVGTQFVPERDVRGTQEVQRVLVAVSVALDSAIVLPLAPVADVVFPEGTRLVVSDWKNDAARMKVYVHTSDRPQLALSDVAVARLRPNFLVVESLDTADLAVTRVSEDTFALSRLDAKLVRYVVQDMQLAMPLTNLPAVLDAVGHFNYFLARHNTRDPLGPGGVQLEMYSLRGAYGARAPDPDVGNLVVANEAHFRLDRHAKYGFAICNYSAHDLFPYLFYFDPATYSIDAWFLPQSSTMAAPLPAKKGADPTRITVGYGAGGGYAFQFVLPEGIVSDTGFLKVFYSTRYLDLKRIEQPAAVDALGVGRDSQAAERLAMDADIWGALDVAVTMFTVREEPQDELLLPL